MTFDWTSYASLAKELVDRRQTLESASMACIRTSISRSYYAVFCTARNSLEIRKGWVAPKDKSVHTAVRDRYHTSADRREKRIGVLLHRLWVSRVRADYKDAPAPPIVPKTAEIAYQMAAEALGKLDALPTS